MIQGERRGRITGFCFRIFLWGGRQEKFEKPIESCYPSVPGGLCRTWIIG
jgi:hypothetical protein